MSNVEREELLSAYLDGELSPEERARVEGWLAESSTLRQLHDELLALRADLQSLPRHALPRDLGASVAQSSAQSVPAAAAHESGSHRLAPPERGDADGPSIVPGLLSWWQRGGNTRRLLWPAIAVAAALAILVYDASQRPDEQHVALAPEAAEADLAATAREEIVPLAATEPVSDAAPLAMDAAGDLAARQQRSAEMAAEPAVGAAPREVGRSAKLADRPSVGSGAPAMRGFATAPAPAADEAAAPPEVTYFEQKAGPKSPGPPTFVCSVSPEFYNNRKFEKLLDANQIVWRRVAAPSVNPTELARSQALPEQRIAPLEPLDDTSPQSLYYLQATSEQVGEILSQVPQSSVVSVSDPMPVPRLTVRRSDAAGEGATGVQILLVAPTEQQTRPASNNK